MAANKGTVMKAVLVGFAIAFAAGASVQSAQAQSNPVILITEEEGVLPAPPGTDLKFRAGVSRGPAIMVVSPKPDKSGVRSPFRLQMKFEGRSGAQVDPDSVKLTYNKKTAVDLTPRVKPYVLAAGIDLPETQAPPGEHSIRVDVKDKDGRSSSMIFVINVVK